MLLENKVAIVTGASRGIGRGIAVALATQGARVVLNYHAGEDSAFERDGAITEALDAVHAAGAAGAGGAAGGKAISVSGDVALAATAESLVEAAVGAFGRLDIMVANAGICPFHSYLDMPEALFRRVVDVNLTGTFLTTQAAAKRMVAQGEGGAIIATSSISALVGGATQAHYTPTKAGVHSLMQSMAIALGPHGIRCNSVMPGAIETDINRADLADPEKRAYFAQRIPLQRLGRPDDIAGVVVFLASSLAQYVTGAAVLADGGLFVNLQ